MILLDFGTRSKFEVFYEQILFVKDCLQISLLTLRELKSIN